MKDIFPTFFEKVKNMVSLKSVDKLIFLPLLPLPFKKVWNSGRNGKNGKNIFEKSGPYMGISVFKSLQWKSYSFLTSHMGYVSKM